MLKVLFILLFSINAFAVLSEPDKAFIPFKSNLKNPGFENAKTSWTASGGTFTITTTTANIGSGNAAASWDSNAAAQTLTSGAISIPAGFFGKNGIVSCNIQGASATHLLEAYDGTNVLATTTISSSSEYRRTYVNFVLPSSGNIRVQIKSVASNEPVIYVDDCFVGPAEGFNLSQSNQTQFIGSAYFPTTTNCAGWTVSSSAISDFTSDTDCPGPTVDLNPGPGTIQTTDADLPQVTVNGLPAGLYKVTFIVPYEKSTTNYTAIAISDGTTTTPSELMFITSGQLQTPIVVGYFNYTTAANRTFKLRGSALTGSSLIELNTSLVSNMTFSIVKYPGASDLIYKPDMVANSWSGYHGDTNCDFSRTNTAFGDFTADADCNLHESVNINFGTVTSYDSAGSELPGIVFTPSRVGTYKVCADVNSSGSNANNGLAFRLLDGDGTTIAEAMNVAINSADFQQTTPLCGLWKATSTSSKTIKIHGKSNANSVKMIMATTATTRSVIEWSIFQVDQGLPMPIILNSVVSPSLSVEQIARAEVSVTGVVSNESDDWISGNCALAASVFTCTLSSGIFSATPVCQSTISGTTAGAINSTPASSTSVVVRTFNSTTATAADRAFSIICMGPK